MNLETLKDQIKNMSDEELEKVIETCEKALENLGELDGFSLDIEEETGSEKKEDDEDFGF